MFAYNLAQIVDKGWHTSKQAAKAASLSLARHGRMPTFAVLGAKTMWTIYALVDPRTCQIRYVGQTQNHPTVRLEGHLAKSDGNHIKIAWLEELHQLSLKPLVVVLEYAPTLEKALRAEDTWIKRGRELNWPLTNEGRRFIRRRAIRILVEQNPVLQRRPSTPSTVQGWYEWTLDNYLPAHPELLQLDARGRGRRAGVG